jgi:hypothetical protein
MRDAQHILVMLREEHQRWEHLIAGMRDEQIVEPSLPAGLSLKDVIAHLWAWQQRSITRLEAARQNRLPDFTGWPKELDPESEEDLDAVNAWIYRMNHDRLWPDIYRDWREGFLRLIALGEALPDEDLRARCKYPGLEGYALYDVLLGSYNHHHLEHLEPLLTWLQQQG